MPSIPLTLAPRDTSFTPPTGSNPNISTGVGNSSSDMSTSEVVIVLGIVIGVLGIVIAILNLWVNAQTLFLCRKQLCQHMYTIPETSSTPSLSGTTLGTASPSRTTSSRPSLSVELTCPADAFTTSVAPADVAVSDTPKLRYDPQ